MSEIDVFFSILFVEFPTYDWNQLILLKHKTKKMNKIEKICWFWPKAGKISVQHEDDYQNGKNEIRKINDNLGF